MVYLLAKLPNLETYNKDTTSALINITIVKIVSHDNAGSVDDVNAPAVDDIHV